MHDQLKISGFTEVCDVRDVIGIARRRRQALGLSHQEFDMVARLSAGTSERIGSIAGSGYEMRRLKFCELFDAMGSLVLVMD